jgi:hypothetical protein
VRRTPDALRRILRLLFSPEEAELAARLPSLVPVSALARQLDRDEDELQAALTDLAAAGSSSTSSTTASAGCRWRRS